LPDDIRNSPVLTGNDLGVLANATAIPGIDTGFMDTTLSTLLQQENSEERVQAIHRYAQQLIREGAVLKAWQVLLARS